AAGLPRPPIDMSPLDSPAQLAAPAPRLSAGTPQPAGAAAEAAGGAPERRVARLRIVAPASGARVVRDPGNPPAARTLPLRAVADPLVQQVVWYVDNQPFQVADYPYTARWRLKPGEHTFQARLPYTDIASAPVRVRVQ